jgi:hypothetical protein
MRFLQILAIVLTQLSISSLLIVSLLSPTAIRQSFFQFHSLVCGLSAGLALLITGFVAAGMSWDVRFLALTIFGVVLGYVAFRFERPQIGRFCMIVAGLIGVVFGLMPLAGRTMALWGVRTKAMEFFDGSFLLGAALIGTTFVSLTLAYWYQAMRRPLINYLLWLVEAMLVAAGLRIILLVTTLLLLRTSDPQLAEDLIAALWTNNTGILLFTVRVGAGLVVPLLAGLLALQRIREEDYERATRVLVVAEVCVLAGECCAVHLLI